MKAEFDDGIRAAFPEKAAGNGEALTVIVDKFHGNRFGDFLGHVSCYCNDTLFIYRNLPECQDTTTTWWKEQYLENQSYSSKIIASQDDKTHIPARQNHQIQQEGKLLHF